EFIDAFAASLKDLAIELFGTNDKAALVTGIVLTSLALGAVVGVTTRTRPRIGSAAFLVFGGFGAWAYARAPLTSDVVGLLAGGLAAATGISVLRQLHRLIDPTVGGVE